MYDDVAASKIATHVYLVEHSISYALQHLGCEDVMGHSYIIQTTVRTHCYSEVHMQLII